MPHLKDFDYNLPKDLIAQEPIKPRDHSRLLILDKKTGETGHRHFYDIIDYLEKGDVLVLNNSKVMPARLIGKKKDTGGKIEVFLLTRKHTPPPSARGEFNGEAWECLVGGKVKENQALEFEKDLKGEVIKNNNDGTWEVKFNLAGEKFMEAIEKIGLVPLPPYIKRNQDSRFRGNDKVTYQTIYADNRKIGSVAAPTAGLHFTQGLIKKLKKKGVQFEYVTLHVGLGTFAPVKVDDITKHKMHAEWVEADRETIARIYRAKCEGRKIITIGTTCIRTLEAIVSQFPISNFQFPNNIQISNFKFLKQFKDFKQYVDIFIYPGYKFKIVDAMITNFHLPKSTLLMLVSAIAGKKNIDKAYQEAIKKKYRFYSYGDAMFIK